MKIIQCKTNHMTDPLGYEFEKPIFSWKVTEAKGKSQKSARIRVSLRPEMEEPIFDSGYLKEIDSLGFTADISLKPRTRYYWNVTVCTDADETETSAVNWFETGKQAESWSAKWISCESKERMPVFEKNIKAEKALSSARLYICGLGLYEASIDGKKIASEYLTPYCNNYDAWLQYQTYDVTEQLREGGILRVMLGDGWAIGRFGFFSREGDVSVYHRPYELIAEIHIDYQDGDHEVVITDESWSVYRSSLIFSNIYDGEIWDHTLPEAQAEKAYIVEESVPLSARYSLPVSIHERIKPIALIHTPAGEQVLDLGQNLSGIFELKVNPEAGTKIHLQFGEVLQNGNFYNENLRTARAEFVCICDGKETKISPHFTFYGYRYVKVEGIQNLRAEDFTALVLYSDLEQIGKLQTENEKINRLIRNSEWGLKGNFLDVPTDCPQRDERMGWTGDAQVFSATACFMRECYAFYRKYLHDMYTEQKAGNGSVPIVIPSFHYPESISVWGDAACIIPWNVYLFYGDETILREQYDSMKQWVEYIRSVDGGNHGWRSAYQIGDWLALDHPSGTADQCFGGTDEGYIADIYYAYSSSILAKAAGILGEKEDAAEYEHLAERIIGDVRKEYFSETGRCCVNTQTGLLLALQHQVSPNPGMTKEMLLKLFAQTKNTLKTGFVGTPILCGQLTEIGQEKLAYDLLLNEEYPGWLYEVNLGATTIWERWNSMNPDGTVSSTGMNSFNHYAYGSIVEWMFRYAAGLNPTESAPGFREVEIKPVPDGRLGGLTMYYDSAAGRYEISWKAEDVCHLTLKVTIPFGCSAKLTLPYAPEYLYETESPMFGDVKHGICRLSAGTYEITYETTQMLKKIYGIEDPVVELENHGVTRKVVEAYIPRIFGETEKLKELPLKELVARRFEEKAEILPKLDLELRSCC